MNPLSRRWIFIWILVLIGVVFTFWDYSVYRRVETQNYGHGPSDKPVSWRIDRLFQNEDFRIKYPEELRLDEKNLVFLNNEAKVSVEVKTDARGTLKDWEDKEILNLAKNEQVYGERTYENTERTNMTVIRFQRFEGDNTYMVSRYLARKETLLVILEFVVKLEDWQSMEGNVKEMARTLVLL